MRCLVVLVALLVACKGDVPPGTGDPDLAPAAPARDPAAVVLAPGAGTDAPPDLVVVLANGLRSDLGGRPAAEAAFVAGLGRPPAVRFSAACPQSVHGFVSAGSLLTGRYPTAIPLCSWGLGASEAPWCSSIPASVPTLPEVLAIYGYHTALVLTPPLPREHAALAGEFDTVLVAEGAKSTADGVDRALAWWAQNADAPRLLVFFDDLGEALRPLTPPTAATDASPGLLASIQAAYTEVASARGKSFARLLDATLSGAARPGHALVTSAHGLNLGERTGTPSLPLVPVHHDILLERTLHVPMLLFSSSGAGPTQAVDDVVELVDVFPTFARLANVMAPAGLVGTDLLVRAPAPGRLCYAEFGDMIAVRSRSHLLLARLWMHGGTTLDPEITERLVHAPAQKTSFALHDIAADPLQEKELLAGEAALGQALYQEMVRIRQTTAAPPETGLSREQVDALRKTGALSYF